MTYSGRWHVEGHSENIAGVGVYYCHLGDGLEGGSLKFRPKTAPQPDYELNEGSALCWFVLYISTCCQKLREVLFLPSFSVSFLSLCLFLLYMSTDLEVEVQEGSAVVFANTIPHRFRMITNKSETKQRRTFLNFFIRMWQTMTCMCHPDVNKIILYYIINIFLVVVIVVFVIVGFSGPIISTQIISNDPLERVCV